jgi:hypothetical protein
MIASIIRAAPQVLENAGPLCMDGFLKEATRSRHRQHRPDAEGPPKIQNGHVGRVQAPPMGVPVRDEFATLPQQSLNDTPSTFGSAILLSDAPPMAGWR